MSKVQECSEHSPEKVSEHKLSLEAKPLGKSALEGISKSFPLHECCYIHVQLRQHKKRREVEFVAGCNRKNRILIGSMYSMTDLRESPNEVLFAILLLPLRCLRKVRSRRSRSVQAQSEKPPFARQNIHP